MILEIVKLSEKSAEAIVQTAKTDEEVRYLN